MSPALPLSPFPEVDLDAAFPASPAPPFLAGAVEAAACGAEWSVPALTAAVRSGEEAAVRVLHSRYHGRLTRYALVLTRGDEAVAAEAVQTAFLKSLRHLRPLPDEVALWAWLARATRTAAADAGRRGRRYLAVLDRVAALFSRPPEAPAMVEEDVEAVWLAALEKALAGLDTESRALIDARYYQRRPLAEVAAGQASTDRAIEGRLARIREKLRRSILQQLAQSSRHET